MAKQGLFGGGSSLPGVKILTTPVKGSFHVDIPGQPSTCLGNKTALEEQRCIMASSLVTNSLIIPCYDMDKSLLNSTAIAPQGERLPLNTGMPPLITLSCLNSSRIAFKDPSTITNPSFKELHADNSGQEGSGLRPMSLCPPRGLSTAARGPPARPAAAGAKRSPSCSPSLCMATTGTSTSFHYVFTTQRLHMPRVCFQPYFPSPAVFSAKKSDVCSL